MNKREVDFETTVIDYLSQRGYVRRRRLIDYLMESHPNETGYSEPSINRKLANLHKAGKILIESDDNELAKYGIKKEDERASYVIEINYLGRKNHRDYVFGCFNTGNTNAKNKSLDEIKTYQNEWVLSPSHLDSLVSNSDDEDEANLVDKDVSSIDKILEILYNQIINKGIKPGNNDKFLENLRNLLERYPQGHKEYTMLRRRVIWLLGYYNDKAVLKQLIKDAESGKLSVFKDDYVDKFTARVIENGRTELFDLGIKLEEGDTETAKALKEIRKKALDKLEKPKEPDKLSESVLSSPLPKLNLKIKGVKK